MDKIETTFVATDSEATKHAQCNNSSVTTLTRWCNPSRNFLTSLVAGAKNHLIALKDADLEGTTRDVVASFAGASGQRCMAASVLLVVGENDELINNIVQRAGELKLGTDKGEVRNCC